MLSKPAHAKHRPVSNRKNTTPDFQEFLNHVQIIRTSFHLEAFEQRPHSAKRARPAILTLLFRDTIQSGIIQPRDEYPQELSSAPAIEPRREISFRWPHRKVVLSPTFLAPSWRECLVKAVGAVPFMEPTLPSWVAQQQ